MNAQLSAHRSVAVLYSGGGGSTCPTSSHTETEHHFNSSRRACHEDTTQATLHGPGERLPSPTHSRRDQTPPRPRLHWPHSSRHSLGN
ncbi:Hypothetical protein FKW44_014393 [Caligus rogercresseyi]|uniref:Uncharacterized protein n=1 Tax=Caligus rogercresseyi TaxID=217165 RepID=A0A7T8K0E3_CALRO|nr:Hypothetical protein FKW44_014393 [Caligus rogercresseyi]